MNLEKAVELEAMRKDPSCREDGLEERLSARQVARKVFRISAQAGEPFEGITYNEWARKWLASDEFVLMEIPLNRVAVIGRPATNGILAAAHGQSLEPIVVDVNKRKVGQTSQGYTPPVIAVDGQTRHQGAVLRGREKIMAWVGVRALKHVRVATTSAIAAKAATAAAPVVIKVGPTRMDAAMAIHAAMPTRPLPRQDSGDGGPAPTMRSATTPNTLDPDGADYVRNRGAVKRKTEDCEECEGPKTRVTAAGGGGAGTGGATGGPGGSTSGGNPMRRGFSAADDDDDPSDQDQTADPSDRSQIPDPSDRKQSPTDQAPGTGVGPRLRPNKGASNSEMQKILSEGKKVDRIFEAKKKPKVKAAFGGGRPVGGPVMRAPGFGGGGRMRPEPPGGGGRWSPPGGGEGGGGPRPMPGGGGGPTPTPMPGGGGPIVRPIARQGMLSKAKKGKTVKAVAPPGREAQVKKLKKKVGKTTAYKIAWSQKNKGK